jgi:Uma2 family endonuclease
LDWRLEQPIMVTTKLLTAQDLWKIEDRGRKYELIRGELIEVTPPSATHASVMTNLAVLIGVFVKLHRLGKLYTGDGGVVIEHDPDTVLGPDLSFFASERVPVDIPVYFQTPPDLAIEIASPGNSSREIERKIGMYLGFGVREVWIVHPDRRQVIVHSPSRPLQTLHEHDVLTGGDILPGLVIPVSSIFDD